MVTTTGLALLKIIAFAQSYVAIRGRKGRNRGQGRGQMVAAQAAAAGDWLGPERAWAAARGPQISRVVQQVKMLTALVNAEKQFKDTTGSVNPALVPIGQYLNGVAEGDDTQGRQGRSIRAKELEVRLHFYSSTAATSSCTVRVFIIKDNDPAGTVPTTGLLFEGIPTVDGLPTLSSRQGRFKWIFDEVFTLGTLAGGNDTKVLRISMKMDHHISFIDTTGATSGAGQGSLFMYVMADQVTTNQPSGAYYCRLRYYDN